MKYIIFFIFNCLALTKNHFKDNRNESQIWHVNSSAQIDANQVITMRCVSTQIDIIYFNAKDLKYPQICSYERTYSQRLSYNFIEKNNRKPVPTIMRKMYVNETRSNGTLRISSIGFIESGVKSMIGTSFVEVMYYPNLRSGACDFAEGITRQAGTALLIFSNKFEPKNLARIFYTYNHDQLVALFKKQESGECFANSRLRYRTSILSESIIRSNASALLRDSRETTESYIENLAECEPYLSEPVLRITDKQQIKIKDSCDSVNLSDRYESGITRFVVYKTQNEFHSVSVKIIYKSANRNKGSFNETIVGIVTKGPPYLLGTAYLRLTVIPNLSKILCRSEPGLTKLVGSAERIFSNLNAKNLISVMNMESLIAKIRTNRIVDCLGFITVNYEPGLLFHDYVDNKPGYLSNLTQGFEIEQNIQ